MISNDVSFFFIFFKSITHFPQNPSKIEWDPTNGPLSRLRSSYWILRFRGPFIRSVGPVGDFLDKKPLRKGSQLGNLP